MTNKKHKNRWRNRQARKLAPKPERKPTTLMDLMKKLGIDTSNYASGLQEAENRATSRGQTS